MQLRTGRGRAGGTPAHRGGPDGLSARARGGYRLVARLAEVNGDQEMAEDFRARARLSPKGRLFEDFTVGEVRTHHWGRTIFESDTVLFTTLTLSFNPLYTNRAYAEALGHPDIVVNPLLVFNTVLGLSVEDNSEIGGPFVGVGALTYHQPVYPGDTLVARSTTRAARLSASNPANGIVTWHTEGFNQREERVIDFERSNIVRLRHPPARAKESAE